MISGSFVSRRPYTEGRAIMSHVNASGRRSSTSADLRFLVDTGSDRTLISPADFEVAFGLFTAEFPLSPERMSGISGQVGVRVARGRLYLPDDRQRWLAFPTKFWLPETLPGHAPLDFSLLGADVWGQGDVHVNRAAGLVSLEFPEVNPT